MRIPQDQQAGALGNPDLRTKASYYSRIYEFYRCADLTFCDRSIDRYLVTVAYSPDQGYRPDSDLLSSMP